MKAHQNFIKNHYQALIALGLPNLILEDPKKWLFFLQEGTDFQSGWRGNTALTAQQQIQCYRLLYPSYADAAYLQEIALIHQLADTQAFEIKLVDSQPARLHFDFFIDQEPLSTKLGIHRFDLRYCDFDLDLIQVDQTKFPHYNRKQRVNQAVASFLGKRPATNQIDSERIVMYRCHCGSDYCGVVSFTLAIKSKQVLWQDITYQDDQEVGAQGLLHSGVNPIKELRFNRLEYEWAFAQHLKKCATSL